MWVDLDEADVESDDGPLTPDERERVARFDDDVARRRWAAGRLALRRELAARGVEPPSLPVVGSLAGAGPLRFSTSRSGQHAVMAFAYRRVGVDVERIRPVRARHRIAARAFGVPDGDLDDESFVQRWCELEAYVKAIGEPLAAGFATVVADGWEVQALPAPPGHCAAVVVER